jgi:hypothetical protein
VALHESRAMIAARVGLLRGSFRRTALYPFRVAHRNFPKPWKGSDKGKCKTLPTIQQVPERRVLAPQRHRIALAGIPAFRCISLVVGTRRRHERFSAPTVGSSPRRGPTPQGRRDDWRVSDPSAIKVLPISSGIERGESLKRPTVLHGMSRHRRNLQSVGVVPLCLATKPNLSGMSEKRREQNVRLRVS